VIEFLDLSQELKKNFVHSENFVKILYHQNEKKKKTTNRL